jgi:SAM-dependent methyltransferase
MHFVGHKMITDTRAVARTLARKALAQGRPLSWFEDLYDKARHEGATVPWADLVPNPNVLPLFDAIPHSDAHGRALKVGCGYGDDAEWLAQRGYSVTAFDISPTAIAECMRRFPASRVNYVVADLFMAPSDWSGQFELVWESYTLQVLPPKLRPEAIRAISNFVAPDGYLMFASRARDANEPEGDMPWPLTRSETAAFVHWGLSEVLFEDHVDRENPPVRRFRACFRKRSDQTVQRTGASRSAQDTNRTSSAAGSRR